MQRVQQLTGLSPKVIRDYIYKLHSHMDVLRRTGKKIQTGYRWEARPDVEAVPFATDSLITMNTHITEAQRQWLHENYLTYQRDRRVIADYLERSRLEANQIILNEGLGR